MPDFTPNLNLEKPRRNEGYDVEVQNRNMVKIDGELKAQKETFTEQLSKIPNALTIFDGKKSVRFIAHRGLSMVAPENTLPAYELAAKCGAWGAECDVAVTADGHWILMHDDTVDRTTNGTGMVKDLTLAQIKNLTIDGGNNVAKYPNLKVPTLEEFLLLCKATGLVPVIEIKAANVASDYDTLLEVIKKYGYEETAIVISFYANALTEVRNRSKNILIQFLSGVTQGSINYVKNLTNAGLDVQHESLSKELVELAHSNGVSVNSWTVNDMVRAQTLMDFGVDFITSDIVVGGLS